MDTGVIYRDDNLRRLALLPTDSVDLIYLDPPFFSNRHYEVIWGDEAEVRSFEDRWEGGIYHYIEWMRERVFEMKRVLKPSGTIYLHCDEHASHYLKVMMDDLFGRGNFLNEIIWHYQTSGGAPQKTLIRDHDTLLRYSKGPVRDVVWNAPREPWPESTLKKWQRDEHGRIYHIHNDTGKRYYIDPDGKLMDDVWDITLSARSRERLGYPTQKPLALLERLIAASSNEGDIVLDPFCGCGTTLVSAHRLGREWIGIDISPTACDLMKRRLLGPEAGATNVTLEGMPQSLEDLKDLKPFEFQNWIIVRISGHQSDRKSGDMGIDGWTFFLHDPVQVKQSESVGRPVVDSFETAITRANKKRGFVIALSFTRGAHEEVARIKGSGLDIHLVTVEDLLERRDEVVALMSTIGQGELPAREATEMPTIDSRRRSASELIRSAKGR
ncbi:MAG: DNA methyltransferase [Candidatus Dormiibacterota bacterium]